jgi:hypothetical protein
VLKLMDNLCMLVLYVIVLVQLSNYLRRHRILYLPSTARLRNYDWNINNFM